MSLSVLVIGCGSIGRRHIKILKQQGINVSGFDLNPALLKSLQGEIPVFDNLETALKEKPSACFVCTPNNTHIPLALDLAQKKIPFFLEKPLSHNWEGVEDLISLVKKNNLVTLVGCNLRFVKSLKKVKEMIGEGVIGKILSVRAQCGFYLPSWRPHLDYRENYSSQRSQGGGVILDNVHEIDYLQWILGRPKDVFCRARKLSHLELDVEDMAEILFSFEENVFAQLHLDYLQKSYRRSCEFIGEKGLIIWDYIKKETRICTEGNNQWTVLNDDINLELNQMYIDQLNHFIKCLQGEEKSCNDVEEAAFTLKVALTCHASEKSGTILNIH
ncbi:MAG: Gfo/Idh/MocA family oxidoreductase [Deltaproteobacteria bacterium]|nr:Gfo/Idh/MocA family oxidoreductase [Deltaproteobacteria bacterium]